MHYNVGMSLSYKPIAHGVPQGARLGDIGAKWSGACDQGNVIQHLSDSYLQSKDPKHERF